ncbi:f-box protein cpr1 [Quercus suber]|uniref:F-box protein cpr1 n=1 Tax=Quercus suber TaxID=58331 RepID=A0AAW0LBA7_QUESU
MSYLQLELITKILSRLPVKSLVRFLSVSKQWYSLINDPDFVNLHLKHSIETNKDQAFILKEHDFYPTDRYFSVPFLDKNNGFGKAVQIPMPLCHQIKIAIWKSLIRKYKKLPSEPRDYSGSGRPNFAFGHDPHNDDYKVVRIVEFSKEDTPLLDFEVKSLFLLLILPLRNSRSIRRRFYQKKKKKLKSLVVLGGYLCFIVNSFLKYNDVWLMKEYGDSGFIKLSKAPCLGIFIIAECKPLVFSKNGEKVMLKEGHEGSANPVWYDIKMKRGKRVEIQNLPGDFSAAVCIGSLLLLDDGDNVAEEECECKPLVFSKNGEKVMLKEGHEGSANPVWYDIKMKRGKRVEIQNLPGDFSAAVCIGSLLLLDDGDNVAEEER